MYRRICIEIIIILILIMIPRVHAYQFRDYTWGASMAEIEAKLKSETKWFRMEDDRTLITLDRFADEPVQIDFIFTPKTGKLCAVIIRLERDKDYKIKGFLIKKYGNPVKEKKSAGNALWMDGLSAIQLRENPSHLKLIYMHVELYDMYEKERGKKERA
jgi:hypothetical protein